MKKQSVTILGKKTEVKRGKLFHNGKQVFRNKGGLGHDFEFKNKGFAMTKTYYNSMKKELIKFKVPSKK